MHLTHMSNSRDSRNAVTGHSNTPPPQRLLPISVLKRTTRVRWLAKSRQSMKVDKDQFDALLHRMIAEPPTKTATIKSEKKGGTIIPTPKPSAPGKQ
jgi:hypothetical protein